MLDIVTDSWYQEGKPPKTALSSCVCARCNCSTKAANRDGSMLLSATGGVDSSALSSDELHGLPDINGLTLRGGCLLLN